MRFDEFITLHKEKQTDGLRLGQRFYNMYIKRTDQMMSTEQTFWNAVYQEQQDYKVIHMLENYLKLIQVWPDMPSQVRS